MKEFGFYALPGVEIPEYETDGAACMDVIVNDFGRIYNEHNNYGITSSKTTKKTIFSGYRVLIKTGLFPIIPEGYKLSVKPRSGLALKHGIQVLNSPGTIDSDYQGELCVIVHNTSCSDFVINIGDRIAQVELEKVYKKTPKKYSKDEYDSLPKTKRGDGGFGSTGI